MKIFRYISILVFSAVVMFASDSVISYFNASSNGDRIKVEWRTADETNVQKYELERSCKNGSYTRVSELEAKGYSSAYSYSDENALKESLQKEEAVQSGTTLYTYRIKVVNKDKSATYSNSINVSHTTSGVKRTWGMIKEMFK